MFFLNSQNMLKYARIEEERRFLIQQLPEDFPENAPYVRIIDQYIPDTRLRLRRMVSQDGETVALKLAQKYQSPELESHQAMITNIYLNEAEYKLLNELGGLQLTKRRYPYHYRKQAYSIDIFEGRLSGLITAEIEGNSEIEITRLPVPDFVQREITDEAFFSGANLVNLDQAEFQAWLQSTFS